LGEPYLVPQASYSRLVDPTGGRSLPQPLEMICSAPDGDFVAHATKVHETGIPWGDPSGDHLREWLRVFREVFYDPSSFALVPSWRSRIWMKKNPWFEAKLLPVLRRRVKKRLQD